MRNLFLFLISSALLTTSCETIRSVAKGGGASKRNAVAPVEYASTGDRNKDYTNQYREAAILEMERGGVPASIILAQGILESGAGSSDLAKVANNHFGVKCSGSWKGKTYYKKDDDKDADGNLIESCFRKYDDVAQSYYDHGEFLRDPKKHHRYGFLFKLDRTDYKSWARGLQSAGYATNPSYADQLIDLIERYKLYENDRPGALDLPPGAVKPPQPGDAKPNTTTGDKPGQTGNKPNPNLPPAGANRIQRVNDVKAVVSKEGESLADIANAYRIDPMKVADFNDRGYLPGVVLKPNTRVFIQCKKDKWSGRNKEHYTKPGQTMFEIAQFYGVKLNKLLARNRMIKGEEPENGEVIYLKGSRPKTNPVKTRDTSKDADPMANQPVKPGSNTGKPGNPGKMTPNNDDELFEIGGDTPAKPQPNEPQRPPESTPARPTGPSKPATSGATYPDDDPVPNRPNGNTGKPSTNVGEPGGSKPPANPNAKTHLVVKGDTLYNVARKYGVTVAQLKKLNNIQDDNIKIGQTLRIN
jgi:LysM repeat protein